MLVCWSPYLPASWFISISTVQFSTQFVICFNSTVRSVGPFIFHRGHLIVFLNDVRLIQIKTTIHSNRIFRNGSKEFLWAAAICCVPFILVGYRILILLHLSVLQRHLTFFFLLFSNDVSCWLTSFMMSINRIRLFGARNPWIGIHFWTDRYSFIPPSLLVIIIEKCAHIVHALCE